MSSYYPGIQTVVTKQTNLSFRITPSALPMSPSAVSPHMSEDEDVEDNEDDDDDGDVADRPAVVAVTMDVCRYC